MKIVDNIDGVILTINDRTDAIREAASRVKYHNKTFCYRHRGKHVSQNAEYKIDGDTIYIGRKQNA